MFECHGLDFDAVDGGQAFGEFDGACMVAGEFEDEQSVGRATGVVDGVEAESGFDIAAEVGERFLDVGNMSDAVGDMDAHDDVIFFSHGVVFSFSVDLC